MNMRIPRETAYGVLVWDDQTPEEHRDFARALNLSERKRATAQGPDGRVWTLLQRRETYGLPSLLGRPLTRTYLLFREGRRVAFGHQWTDLIDFAGRRAFGVREWDGY